VTRTGYSAIFLWFFPAHGEETTLKDEKGIDFKVQMAYTIAMDEKKMSSG
jgi:hypothetical protein